MLIMVKGAYVLVITAKTDVGNCEFFIYTSSAANSFVVLDSRNEVYGVKSVVSIPLRETRARTILNGVAVKYNQTNMFTEPPFFENSDPSDLGESLENESIDPGSSVQTARVKFSETPEVKIMTPRPDAEFRSSSPTSSITSLSSGASTPLSETDEVSPVAKALASRLSFWSRLSQRQLTQSSDPANEQLLQTGHEVDLEISDTNPSEALQNILNKTSPTPPTIEERQSELDEKILKECIREYTKGGMFFAYNFGMFS